MSVDCGSKSEFDTQKISAVDRTYYAASDEMKDGLKKPTHVQITDKRGMLVGRKLALSQPEQLKAVIGEELVDTQLIFIKVEVTLMVNEKCKPTEVSDTISLTPGIDNNLAMNARKETGVGTRVYRFGLDEAIDKETVQLLAPGKSVKLAQQYSARLVWALEDTPTNN